MEIKTTSPTNMNDKIIELCNSILEHKTPHYVDVVPVKDMLANECFYNLPKHSSIHGGEIQTGWTIWSWSNVLVEAEAHAIWVSPTGEEYDITPKQESKILFLPDENIKFDGRSIPSRRLAYTNSPLVKELIQLSNEKDRLMYETTESDGFISLPAPLIQRIFEITNIIKQRVGRNEPCPCQSGLKYKKCCGV